MPHKYVFQPKINFLEMAHTNFVSSIRKTPYQHLVCTKKEKTMFSESHKSIVFKTFQTYTLVHGHMYRNYTENMTQEHPKHPNTFSTIIFFFGNT